MAGEESISWLAVNKSGEVCLDSDLPPLPRGWERCLDLQSGVMYLKQMYTQPIASNSDGNLQSRGTYKRQRVLLGDDDEGEGNPALELTLSLPTCTNNPGPSYQSSLSHADSLISSELKFLVSQRIPAQEDANATNSNHGSSPPHNACSSSSSSSPPSKYKQLRCQSNNTGIRTSQLTEEKSLIKAAGCPHCFMYVLPSKSDPKCPKCKSSILVDLSPLTIH